MLDNRPLLQSTVTSAQNVLQPLVDQRDQLDDLAHKLPTALTLLGRSAGTYGDFINLYLCDLTLTLNGAAARRPRPHGADNAAADGKVHTAMRVLEPENRVRTGIIAIVLAVLATAVGQTFTSVPMLFAQPRYYAEFSDASALHAGDKVRITGIDVGTVQELKIATGHMVVQFAMGDNVIGTQSRLSIRTDTILGKKILEIEPQRQHAAAARRQAAAEPNHHPVPDL